MDHQNIKYCQYVKFFSHSNICLLIFHSSVNLHFPIKANWKWSNEMARVNVDILGISELKWTGMGEFNSDDHYIYYCGQES